VSTKFQNPVILLETEKLRIQDQPMPELPPDKKIALKDSIKEFGIKYPIAITTDHIILDGRNRYEIAKELGYLEVPCLIVDTDENPAESVLKYDLELFRRSLTAEEEEELLSVREEYLSSLRKQSLEKVLSNIIPELHDSVCEIYEKNSDLSLLYKIASLPPDSQKALVREVEITLDGNEDSVEEIKRLNNREKELSSEVARLQEKISEMSEIEKNYKEAEKKIKMLESGLRKKIEEKIKEKEKEIEEKYSIESPDKLSELLKQEREKIRVEYSHELKRLQNDLHKMSLSRNEVVNQVETLKQEIEDVKRQKKDTETITTKLNNDLTLRENLLKGLVKPDKFAKRFKLISEDLNNIFTNLLEVGADTIDDSYKEEFNDSISEIKDTIGEIEKFIKTGK
jgi:ParB-like chromosome segregation protein Spo0J